MEPYIIEWANMLLRWLHITAAIAWIGSSFFFMHLDASLRADPSIKLGGSAWQVHGGGFYQMKKFFVAPDQLPTEITWHKWQSYWTWISGFFLLVAVYYAQSTLYLIDPSVMALSGVQASALGIGSLATGWFVYDRLCKSPLGKSDNLLAIAGFGFVIAMSWLYTQVFSGRGALIHSGALMATMMTGNVALNIMPNQRKVIAMLEKGETPDPSYGKQAKQRSGHNNYITLPVLFMMISNHYPIFWANSACIPLTVFLVIVAGAIIRHFYNVRHADHKKSPYWAWGLAAIALLIAFVLSLTSSPAGRSMLNLSARDLPKLALAERPAPPDSVVDIVVSRCSMCHAAEPVWEGVQIAPKGVMLETPEQIARQAEAIRLWAVLTHAMPPNNLTEITQDERSQLAEWLKGWQG